MASGSVVELKVPRWLKQRVHVWMKRMGLDKEWTITIHFQEKVTDKGQRCKALSDWTEGYRSGDIWFAKWYYDKEDARVIDILICHELYHFVQARERDRLAKLVGYGSFVFDAYEEESEQMAEKFAIIFVGAYARKRSTQA